MGSKLCYSDTQSASLASAGGGGGPGQGGGWRRCTVKKKCTKDRLGADMSGAGEESLDANQTMAASAAHNQTGTRQRGPGLPQEADLLTLATDLHPPGNVAP